MFGTGKLKRDGVAAQALVLDKKVYGTGVESGLAKSGRYRLRVRFADGSTAEVSRRVWSARLANFSVGELIPVRYDDADHSKVIIDGPTIKAQRVARERELRDEALKRGESELDQS
jgi:hypothetical protein